MNDDLLIIGGGISGLTCAHHAQRNGLQCRLLEATDRLGGHITTVRLPSGQIYDCGPKSLRFRRTAGRPTLELLQQLDLEKYLIRSSKQATKRLVLLNGIPQTLPHSFWSALTSPLGRHLMTKSILEPLQKSSDERDESVASFFQRRAPSPIIQKLTDALCSGIWGGNPHKLSIYGTFPELKIDEVQWGSVVRGRIAALRTKETEKTLRGIYSLKEGLGLMIRALEDSLTIPVERRTAALSIDLTSHGVVVQTAQREFHAKRVILAVPEPIMSRLYPPLFHMNIPHASFATVVMGFEERIEAVQGYGLLAPASEDPHVLGIVFDSSVFPEQNSPLHTRLSVILGGDRWPEVVSAREEDLLRLSQKALKDWVGIQAYPDEYGIFRADAAIPQIPVGSPPLCAYRSSRCERIFAIGPSIGGVSINQCIASAKETMKQIIYTQTA